MLDVTSKYNMAPSWWGMTKQRGGGNPTQTGNLFSEYPEPDRLFIPNKSKLCPELEYRWFSWGNNLPHKSLHLHFSVMTEHFFFPLGFIFWKGQIMFSLLVVCHLKFLFTWMEEKKKMKTCLHLNIFFSFHIGPARVVVKVISSLD